MDLLLVLYSIFSLGILSNCESIDSPPSGLAHIENENRVCDIKLDACKVNFDKGALLMKNGPIGPKGEKGDPGWGGLPGIAGKKGDGGLKGEPGQKGDTGEIGSIGAKGDKGDVGQKGDVGANGTCSCPLSPIKPKPELSAFEDGIHGDVSDSGSVTEDLGSMESPLRSCKDAPREENSNYFIRPGNSFEVFCDIEKERTCLVVPETSDDLSETEHKSTLNHGDQPFWLSERLNITQFYLNYDIKQLEYLQRNSNYVVQKIRYHCKNSAIVPPDNPEGALRLLTWKDQVIGHKASKHAPFHYNIDHDDCKDSATEWKHADITLSDQYGRLPIIDFYIQNIGSGGEQMFYLQLKELCFVGF